MKYFFLIITMLILSSCTTWENWQTKRAEAKLKRIAVENKIKAKQEEAARKKKAADKLAADKLLENLSKDKKVAGGGTAAKKTTYRLEEAFSLGATGAFPLAIILLVAAAGFKSKRLLHLSGLIVLAGVLCMVGVYSLHWIWWIIAAAFWCGLFWGIYYVICTIRKHKEKDHVIEELGKHFDDDKGNEKISKKAHDAYVSHRYKGDIHNWKKVRTEDKVKENNNLKEGSE